MSDRAGRVRWYFSVTSHPALSNLFYDDGIEALASGNLYFGDQSTNAVVEWNWYQHAPLRLPDGAVMLFDNGGNRQFSGAGPYSRAVACRIDPVARTVRQVWQYGKERGAAMYPRIVSDVDFDDRTRTVLFAPGAVRFSGVDYGNVVEVSYDSRRVLFEATVIPPVAPFEITMHRVERVPMYPPSVSAVRPAL